MTILLQATGVVESKYTPPRTFHTCKFFSRVAQVAAFCVLSQKPSSSRAFHVSHFVWSCISLVKTQHSGFFFCAFLSEQDKSLCNSERILVWPFCRTGSAHITRRSKSWRPVMEELAEVCQHVLQKHIQARIAEVWLWLTQEQVQQRIDEQFVDVPMRKNLEECVAVVSWAPSIGTQGAGRQVLLRHVPLSTIDRMLSSVGAEGSSCSALDQSRVTENDIPENQMPSRQSWRLRDVFFSSHIVSKP